MASKTFNISLDEALVKEIDKLAKAKFSTRSSFIRASLLNQIDREKAQIAPSLDKEYQDFVKEYGQTLKNLANRWLSI